MKKKKLLEIFKKELRHQVVVTIHIAVKSRSVYEATLQKCMMRYSF